MRVKCTSIRNFVAFLFVCGFAIALCRRLWVSRYVHTPSVGVDIAAKRDRIADLRPILDVAASHLTSYSGRDDHGGRSVVAVERPVAAATRDSVAPGRTTAAVAGNGSVLQLNDIFISIKTTAKYHGVRVELQMQTWITLASDHTYIFTDADDAALSRRTNNHVINTKCPSPHTRDGLCCKMSSEFDFFINSKKKWWCHVDDDTYVNVPMLLRLLRRYRHQQDWYIGKTSTSKPLVIRNPDVPEATVSYLFATGGAGFCISRGLALKMVPYASGGKFTSKCQQTRVPDDCMIGFIINYYLHQNLTIVKLFWSHLDGLSAIRLSQLHEQVTFGYSSLNPNNIVLVPGFNLTYDPSRFLSIHCYLFSAHAGYCPRVQQSAH